MEKLRGRGKNKCYWKDEETQLLIEVLRDMASDPSWKTNGGFRSNYMVEVHRRIVTKMPTFSKQVSPHIESKVKWLKTKFHIINDMVKQSKGQWNDVEKKIVCERQWYKSYCQIHKEAKGLWDFKFPFFTQLGLIYGRDKANGAIVEVNDDGIPNMKVAAVQVNGDAIHNTEGEQNTESESETLGESPDSLSEDEENGVHNMSQETPTASNSSNTKRKNTPTNENGVVKKRKTTPPSLLHDIDARLDGIDSSFRAFVEGFNANFAIMANVVANTMRNDNVREKATSEKLKDAIDEIVKFNLSSDDVFKAADIFAANKNKIDVFFCLPEQLRVSYVIRSFNSSFATMANDVMNAMTDDNIRQKVASGKLKQVIAEIVKLDFSRGDVFKVADMFVADRNRMDVFFGLPKELRAPYVRWLTGLSSSN